MTNFEKWESEIKKIIRDNSFIALIDNKPVNCSDNNVSCLDCQFDDLYKINNDCTINALEWLYAEYKEPEKPQVDWRNIAVDTMILVKDCKHSDWRRRYFAKYENGKVYAWPAGATSWSTHADAPIPYNFAIPAGVAYMEDEND